MLKNKLFYRLCLFITLYIAAFSNYAQQLGDNNGLGQTIQIYTQLHSFVGKPSWLLIIRDVDNGQNIPYLYDIERGNNFWLAFTYGRNYLITVSSMQFAPYRRFPDRKKIVNNFCNLESNGHIIRGESLYITIAGDLSPFGDGYTCHVSRFADTNFAIAPPSASDSSSSAAAAQQ